MSLAAGAATTAARSAAGRRFVVSCAVLLLEALVPLWVFSGALVMAEPSPYELMFIFCLGVALFGGFSVHRSTLGLLLLVVAAIPFAVLAAFQGRYNDPADAFIYQ